MKSNANILVFYTYKDYLSNFYNIKFEHKGFLFRNSEQAIMWRKAIFFNANAIAEQILESKNPNDAKRLGRSRDIAFNEKIWENNRLNIFKEVLFDKFNQNYLLKKMLLLTDNKLLAEASPTDIIWGIGMGEDNCNIFNISKWEGQNLLGKVLMEVRELIKIKS